MGSLRARSIDRLDRKSIGDPLGLDRSIDSIESRSGTTPHHRARDNDDDVDAAAAAAADDEASKSFFGALLKGSCFFQVLRPAAAGGGPSGRLAEGRREGGIEP